MSKTVHRAAMAYLQYLKGEGKSERTLYTYGKDLEQIEEFFGRDREVATIRPAQVGRFYNSSVLLKLPDGKIRADETIKKTKRVLRMFFVWANEMGLVDSLPLPKGADMGKSVASNG